jgi:hypothetical protein
VKIRSGKAKGRRCAKETKDLLVKYAPFLQDDIVIPVGSVPGADLILSPRALETYPFSFECKNCEKLNIWKALEQAEGHATKCDIPLLVFKRNHSKTFVALAFDTFLKILSGRE